jgi:hypothetical protein
LEPVQTEQTLNHVERFLTRKSAGCAIGTYMHIPSNSSFTGMAVSVSASYVCVSAPLLKLLMMLFLHGSNRRTCTP